MKTSDVQVKEAEAGFVPVRLRMPLKFGNSTITSITCCRVKMTVERRDGTRAAGYGETPLSVGWGWPDPALSFEFREEAMIKYCRGLAEQWSVFPLRGHPMELGHDFNVPDGIPELAALICNSAFDLALHDAAGRVNGVSAYRACNAEFMNRDLAHFFGERKFRGKYPEDYLVQNVPLSLPVWHLVGGNDPLTDAERTGKEPDDGYPVTLEEWIQRDGLYCLKIKLTGTDNAWDLARMRAVGAVAAKYGVRHLSPDFNCLVRTPEYVNGILDELRRSDPTLFDRILYVEQPFPRDLAADRIDVRAVAERKPLFLDESAHNWRCVRTGFELGWNGVALKVCKTLTGALLSACWAKEHGMRLMVQDLTNPGLAMIPHVQLAAYVGTVMGVECNAPQFYPEASRAFEKNHPGLYRRLHGRVELSTLGEIGLGYRQEDLALCRK